MNNCSNYEKLIISRADNWTTSSVTAAVTVSVKTYLYIYTQIYCNRCVKPKYSGTVFLYIIYIYTRDTHRACSGISLTLTDSEGWAFITQQTALDKEDGSLHRPAAGTIEGTSCLQPAKTLRYTDSSLLLCPNEHTAAAHQFQRPCNLPVELIQLMPASTDASITWAKQHPGCLKQKF